MDPSPSASATSPNPTSPRWMRHWLVAAGIYNLVWGAAMVLAPVATLRALGVTTESTALWPQFWACIGMIVGVYGVGYLIASRNPARHWPIVLVGLLGKIFGPIGFVDAALKGLLPWSMGVTLLTNDLLWWIPFSLILWHAAKVAQATSPDDPVPLETALNTLKTSTGRSLRDLTDERETLVVLLRHSGCTFCKQTLEDLARRQDEFERADIRLVVVGMSSDAERLRAHASSQGLTKAIWVADPDRLLYRALELRRGSFMQLFGPSVWIPGFRALLRGHGVGPLEGDGFQMPGAFVIHRATVVRAYRHRSAADQPNLKELACPIR